MRYFGYFVQTAMRETHTNTNTYACSRILAHINWFSTMCTNNKNDAYISAARLRRSVRQGSGWWPSERPEEERGEKREESEAKPGQPRAGTASVW